MLISRDQFERNFEQIQASWGFEGQELNSYEKELLRRVCMGEISKEEFNRSIHATRLDTGINDTTHRPGMDLSKLIRTLEEKKTVFYEKMLSEENLFSSTNHDA